MKSIILLVLFLIFYLGIITAQNPCTAMRHFSDEDEFWDFRGFAGNSAKGVYTPVLQPNPDPWTYTYTMCSNIQAIIADVTKEKDVNRQLGWSHGTIMDGFSYVGMEIHTPPPASSSSSSSSSNNERTKKETKSSSQSNPVKLFEQDFVRGDVGSPCPTGRLSSAFIYCGNPGANCLSIPGTSSINGSCLDNFMPQNEKLCICAVQHAPDISPCSVNISVLLIGCPQMTSSRPNSPSSPPGPSGGAIFGIIVLVLFLVILVLCIGGFAYNYKVNDLRGVDAIPFVSVIKSARNREYQPQPTTSTGAYGSVGSN